MVDCSVGLHDTEMGPARLTAVTPAAIDVAVGSGASKKQGRGTRPTSQTQRAEDRIASRARPVTRPIFLHSIFARVEEFLHCYKTCAKQKPQPGVGYPAPRARHESRNTCEYTDVSDRRTGCELRRTRVASPSSPVGLGRDWDTAYATESATTPCTVHDPTCDGRC